MSEQLVTLVCMLAHENVENARTLRGAASFMHVNFQNTALFDTTSPPFSDGHISSTGSIVKSTGFDIILSRTMASKAESLPASTSEKIATAVAPPSAAQPSTVDADKTEIVSTQGHLPSARFLLTEKALDDAFNDIWANNANAISHCYSNTDALKVDFTRTGKRSFLGMINDATNSVYRMVQGAVTDFFRQTVLDFTYGSIGLNGLERYYDDLNSRDPSESIRLARVRASAIESCRREVVPDSEVLLGGWTLCSPLQANVIQALKLEEKVALLTPKALYVCSYDFGSEKLNEFTKVLVGDIVGIQEGKSRSPPPTGNANVGARLTVI